MYLLTKLYQIVWLIEFVSQKPSTSAFKNGFSVQNNHLNLCMCVVNHNDYFVVEKQVLNGGIYSFSYTKFVPQKVLLSNDFYYE